ncbi:hypothetical protein B296_00048390, partial [Ensete ventricosum]
VGGLTSAVLQLTGFNVTPNDVPHDGLTCSPRRFAFASSSPLSRKRSCCPPLWEGNRGLAMDGEKKKPMVSDAGAWAMNVVSAVGLIMANKQLMSNSGYGFSFGTPALLTCLSSSISKLSIIPVVCLMEYFLHSKHYSSRVIMAVTAVALGVSICTVTDVEIKAKGLLCACVAVVIAIGHMKTVCVLVLGWLLFDSALTLKNILGMLLAVVGMVVYSWAVEHEKKAKVSPDIRVDSKLDGGVEKLLGKGSGVATSDIELARSES